MAENNSSAPLKTAEGAATLWCVHVTGADDVHPMPSREVALDEANGLNISFCRIKRQDVDPVLIAVVAEWPHSADSHAAGLMIRDECLRMRGDQAVAAQAAPAAVGVPASWSDIEDDRPTSRADLERVMDEWNETTGALPRDSGWRAEVLGMLHDAYDLGAHQATPALPATEDSSAGDLDEPAAFDATLTNRVIEALQENEDPVSVDAAEEMAKLRDLLLAAPQAQPAFQQRVQPWMMECFGPEISADRIERNHRFLEEALELVQATGCTQSEAHQLVDYVFGRPVGEPAQEVGGVMVTLAALCLANGLDMHQAGETELARVWTKVEAIRAKQAAKPKHSPLPQAQAQPANALEPIRQAVRDYHYALDTRQHGGVAADTALKAIVNSLDMPWQQGQEAARRAASPQEGGAQ